MSIARYLKLASVVFVGSLLALVDGLAQQQPVVERVSVNDYHQLENIDQPTDAPRSVPVGTPFVKTTNKPVADAAEATKPVSEAGASIPTPAPLPEALFLPSADHLSPLDKAYLDAFSILRGDNSCSRFFGGARVIEVLNELKKQLKSTDIDSSIAVKMSGTTMSVTSRKYGVSYRLFARAELNLRGSFYHANTFHSGASVPWIGSFSPNTREARVTILLHELGHLVETSDKSWLLPNDGNDASLSSRNTQQIIAVCGEQIRQLSGTSFEHELQMARSATSDSSLQASIQQ